MEDGFSPAALLQSKMIKKELSGGGGGLKGYFLQSIL